MVNELEKIKLYILEQTLNDMEKKYSNLKAENERLRKENATLAMRLEVVSDHDRIYKPDDDDYRLPNAKDGRFVLVELPKTYNWFPLAVKWVDFLDQKPTWRRIPRGPKE